LTGSDPPLKKVDFRKVAKDWADEFLPSLAPRTALRERGFLDNKILPALGDIPPKELTLPLVLDRVLKPIQADGHINTLNKVKIVLSKVFRYAVAHGLMERDFTVDMKGAFPAEKPVHFASITDPVRVGCLLRDIDDYPGSPVVGHALKILPYVFVRPGELRNAEWHEVNLDKAMWRIPSKKMKMKVEHLVPLAPQVIRLLSSLKGLTGGGRLLFPGARTKERPITDMTLTAGLRRIGYEGRELCPHGFRSMASTLLNELGYPTDWVELQLAHRERNKVRAAYNRAEHLDDRKRMMQEWADYLDSLRADVVPPARKTP
jgi:integrase